MAIVGHGSTITFTTSAFAAELLEVSDWSLSCEDIETWHMGTTGYKTFTPSELIDPGEISVRFAHDAADDPPIDQVAEDVKGH